MTTKARSSADHALPRGLEAEEAAALTAARACSAPRTAGRRGKPIRRSSNAESSDRRADISETQRLSRTAGRGAALRTAISVSRLCPQVKFIVVLFIRSSFRFTSSRRFLPARPPVCFRKNADPPERGVHAASSGRRRCGSGEGARGLRFAWARGGSWERWFLWSRLLCFNRGTTRSSTRCSSVTR
jgi:hypothetical protein